MARIETAGLEIDGTELPICDSCGFRKSSTSVKDAHNKSRDESTIDAETLRNLEELGYFGVE